MRYAAATSTRAIRAAACSGLAHLPTQDSTAALTPGSRLATAPPPAQVMLGVLQVAIQAEVETSRAVGASQGVARFRGEGAPIPCRACLRPESTSSHAPWR